jgi:NOL1/NOP2/sun family putative RNA methylase
VRIDTLFSRYKPVISDFNGFLAALQRPLVQSFRINILKAKKDAICLLLKDLKAKPLAFYDSGFTVGRRVKLGNHITHNLGLIYVQEVASMIPVVVLDPQPGEVVLDLCAAPGSKTTQIAQLMDNSGLLVANELSRKRIRGLMFNCKRCGLLNEAIIAMHGQRIDRVLPDYFDRILIDAPCSAEGTVRKSKAVLYHWGVRNIKAMAKIQKGLAVAGFRALRAGGTMVYATCTIAPEENEGVIAYLLEKFPEAELMPIHIPHFKMRAGITRWEGERFDKKLELCARVLPQDNDTAPFFLAKITKRGLYRQRVDYMGKIRFEGAAVEKFSRRFGAESKRIKEYSVFQERDTSFVATPQVYSFREVRTLRKGLEVGKIYDQEIKPDNDFVQLFGRNARRNCYEVKEWQLKKILNGQTIRVAPHRTVEPGFVIVTFKQLPVAVGRYNGKELKSSVKRERRIPT